jgi:hypothetical protein
MRFDDMVTWGDSADHPAEGRLHSSAFFSSVRRLGAMFLAERGRWFLFTPAAFGTGIALYFSLAVEPPP